MGGNNSPAWKEGNFPEKLSDEWPCNERTVEECLYYCYACYQPREETPSEIAAQLTQLLHESEVMLSKARSLLLKLQEQGES